MAQEFSGAGEWEIDRMNRLERERAGVQKNNRNIFARNSSGSVDKEKLERFISQGGEAEKYLPKNVKKELANVREKYRDAKKLGGQTKTLLGSVLPWNFFSLLGEINFFRDWTYGLALFAAILKDLLDFSLTALEIASVATVVLTGLAAALASLGIVIGMITNVFIMMMMILGNIIQPEGHDRTIFQSVILKKYGVLLVVFIIETFFSGINLIPIETIGVLLIYLFALAERKGRHQVLNNAAEK